jgi:hypothetical protein
VAERPLITAHARRLKHSVHVAEKNTSEQLVSEVYALLQIQQNGGPEPTTGYQWCEHDSGGQGGQ